MSNKKELEPNYQMLLHSYVSSINTELDQLRREKDIQNRSFGLSEDGTFWVYSGYEEREKKIQSIENNIRRLTNEMMAIKEKIYAKV